ncbi:MAG: glycosyltransferase family 39 protein, partial [Saprospiraceae bacterium]
MAKSSAGSRKSQVKKQPIKVSQVKNPVSSSPTSDTIRWGLMALLITATLITLYTRIRLLSIPMERDEAGFAYIGHWLLHGKDLYADMVDNKLPGLYTLYALFTTLFGYNSTGVHIGLLLSNIVSGICFYFLLRELYNRFIATAGTAFFIVLMVSFNVLGFAAHATQLLMPFVLGGWLAFWKGILNAKRMLLLAAGLLLGIAFVIKQQSVVFCLLAAMIWWPLRLWWYREKKLPWMEYAWLAIGGLLPTATVAIYFLLTDRFDQLVFWAYTQPAGMSAAFTTPRMEMFKG